MFWGTLLATIIVLAYMRFFRAFLTLKVGKTYRSHAGDVIRIGSQIQMGKHTVFVGTNNRHYYGNGECVEERGLWNPGRLYETA